MINKKIITTLAILLFNLSAINVAYAAKTGELNFGGKANYIGEVRSGKAHGIGALQTTDGTNFIGKFNKNIIHGDGILIKLDANNALADLKISDNFPQLNKNEILDALNDFRDSWADLKEVEGQVRESESGKLLQLKVQRQNLKKEFFESTYPEWWVGMLKKANNDEKLLLDEIQIFFGKWKYGIFTEYLDKKKNFRRQTKLKKLDQIGHDKGNLVNIIIPIPNNGEDNFNQDIADWNVNDVKNLNIDGNGNRIVDKMPIIGPSGNTLFYTGVVDEDNLPAGKGVITQVDDNKEEVVVEGDFGPDGKLKNPDNIETENLDIKLGFVASKNGVKVKTITYEGTIIGEDGTEQMRGKFTINIDKIGTEDETFTGVGKINMDGVIMDGTFNKDGTFTGTRTQENGGAVFNGVVNVKTQELITGTETYANGTSFCCTFKGGKPFEGDFTGINGDKIASVVNGEPEPAGSQTPDEIAAANNAAAAAAALRTRRGSIVESKVQVEVNNTYYDATFSGGDVGSSDPETLRIEAAKAAKAGKKNKGKKNLKRKAKKIEARLKNANLSPKNREKLEKRLSKINEKLGSGSANQASVSAPSIEISEKGQQQLDTDKAEATAAATGNNDTGGGGGMGGGS